MENKILITLAVFSISILLAQVYVNNVNAQLVIETATLGGTSTFSGSVWRDCKYDSTTQVWCATTTGIKVWNPTSRTLTTTLQSGSDIYDIECGSTYCYSWFYTGTPAVSNLTKWQKSGFIKINSTLFTGNTGFIGGHGIGLVTVSDGQVASDVLLLPVEGQTCLGASDNKGMCIFDGATFTNSRFITSSATSDTANVYDIIWNGELASISDPTANRGIVKFRDAAGNFQLYNINLASSGTTFATTQVCNSGTVSGGLTDQAKMSIVDGILYDPINNDLWNMDTTNSLCSEVQKVNLVDESSVIGNIDYNSNDDFYMMLGTTDGSVETNGLYLFNGTNFEATTSFSRLLKVNLTDSANNFVWSVFQHDSEGELDIWRGSQIVIISGLLEIEEPNPNTEFCEQPENFNLLRCVLERGDTTPLIGASELVNASATTLVCQIGLIACTDFVPDNPDIQTNGVGYIILVVSLGIMIGIFWVASRGDLGDIPTFVWVLATLSIVGIITAFEWINPTVLIIAVIAIIALATAKAKGIFGNSGLFTGDT